MSARIEGRRISSFYTGMCSTSWGGVQMMDEQALKMRHNILI